MTNEQRALIEQKHHLADAFTARLVARKQLRPQDYDDVRQLFKMRLIADIDKFQHTKSAFATWAWYRFKQEWSYWCYRQMKRPRQLDYDPPDNHPVAPAPSWRVIRRLFREAKLSARNRYIIIRHIRGDNLRIIAARCRLTRERVRQIEDNSFRRLTSAASRLHVSPADIFSG